MLKEKNNMIVISGSTSRNFKEQINIKNIDDLQKEQTRKFLEDVENDVEIVDNGETVTLTSKLIDFDKLDNLIKE